MFPKPNLRTMFAYDESILNPLEDCFQLAGRFGVSYLHISRVKNEVLRQCGHFAVIQNSPQEFKQDLESWVALNAFSWGKLMNTTMLEYDPITNYDRTEEEELTITKEDSRSGSQTSTAESEDVNSSLSIGTNNNEKNSGVSAFNSSDFVPRSTETDSGNHDLQTDGTATGNYSGDVQTSESGESKVTTTRKIRAYGNIGVTTSQQMIEAERNIALFNVYQVVIDAFKSEFCIMVY